MLKQIVKNNLYLAAGFYVSNNIRLHVKRYLKNNQTSSGTTHQELSLQDSIKYITEVFFDYKKVAQQNLFHGKVAELGPGDSDGVALMFLAHGASQVDLADRFYSMRNATQQQQIKQALIAQYPALAEIPDLATKCVRYYGEQASGENFFDHHNGYNFIVSRSVLEHVDNPELVLHKMYDALAPGGLLIHKVDLRDHGMFTPFAHSLRFLEIPTWVYQKMTLGSGYPNRFLFHRYKEALRKLDVDVKIYITSLHGVAPFTEFYPVDAIPADIKNQALAFVNSKRAKFAKEFANVSSEDLSVESFFLVCRKTQI